MTLLQLQYFKTLARVLHYTQAAAELHIAQPSLSYSIKELEKELGVKLFEKDSRHIRLTIYGEQFLPMWSAFWPCWTRGVGGTATRLGGLRPADRPSGVFSLSLRPR